MLLRSKLAAERGDRMSATRWSAAARALWGGGDPEVRALLQRISQ
jgi:hypothetical protein